MNSLNSPLAEPPDRWSGVVAVATLKHVEYQECGEHLAAMMLCGG